MKKTQFTLLQVILSVEANDKITIGIFIGDGEHTSFISSNSRMELVRQCCGDDAYDMVYGIVKNLEADEGHCQRLMSPEYHNYLQRYANNLVTVSPMHSMDCQIDDVLKNRLFKQYLYSA